MTVETRGRRGLLAVLGLTLVAALVRLTNLSSESLWIDEAWGYWLSSGSFSDVFRRVGLSDVHPPLFHVIQWAFLHLGSSEAALRLPSAAVGTLGVPLMYVAGRRLFTTRAGLLAAAVLALSPVAVHHARDARYYALLLTLALLSLVVFLELVRTRRLRHALLLGLANALVLHTQYTGAFFVVALLLASLLYGRRAFGLAALSAAVTGLLFLPWLLFASRQFTRVAAGFWISPPDIATVLRSLSGVAVLGPYPGSFPIAAGVALSLVWLGVVAAGAIAGRRERGPRLLLALLLTPLLMEILVSFARPILLMRTLVFLLIPITLLAAGFVTRRGWRPALAALLLATLLPGTVALHLVRWKEDWRGGIAALAERSGEGEVIVVDAFIRKSLDYYGPRLGVDAALPVVDFPSRETVPDLDGLLRVRLGSVPRSFWFLMRPTDQDDVRTRELFSQRYALEFVHTRNNASVLRFVRR